MVSGAARRAWFGWAVLGCVVVLAPTACGTAKKSSGTTTTTTAETVASAPVVPCPSASTATSSATPVSSSAPNGTATWTGVFERVRVHLNSDGSTAKTPRQRTIVSASGHGLVTIGVPVSKSHLHSDPRGNEPPVVDGRAQVSLKLNGTAAEQLESDYKRPLPVSVEVTYKLNGKTISAKGLKGKSGSVEADYHLTNTTSTPVTVCFKGFNGALVKQTVTAPQPIIAYLSLTMPKGSTSFHAEGAALAPARHGISVSWTRAMFEPFQPTSQTFVLTMSTSKAKVPNATLLLETLNPLKLTGSAPAQTAAALANAVAAAQKSAAQVQSDVSSLQQQASESGGQPKSSKHRGSSGTVPLSSLSGVQHHAGRVRATTRASEQTARSANATLAGSSRGSVASLESTTNQAITGLGVATTQAIDSLAATMNSSLARLASDTRRAPSDGSITAMTAKIARLQTDATALDRRAQTASTAATRLHTRLAQVVAQLPAPVADALQLVQKLHQVQADLDALAPTEQATPEFQGLVGDLAAAQTAASALSSELTGISNRLDALTGSVRVFQGHVAALKTQLLAVEAAAAAAAGANVTAALTRAAAAVGARLTAATAVVARATARAAANAKSGVDAAEQKATASVSSARTSAHDTISGATQRAQRSVQTAERKANRELAAFQKSVDQALNSAKQKARQSGQSTLASTEADANKAEASAKSALNSANASYARLLALNEQAMVNQLPGGDAAVTEQNGSFLYQIKGT